MRRRPRTVWRFWTAAAYAVAGLALSMPVAAQTLDQAVGSQLSGDCAALGGENSQFGADLNAICTQSFGSPTGTANSGGAGASSQTTAVSVENRRKSRLEKEDVNEESKSAVTPEPGSRWSLFVTGNTETLDRDRTTFADGYDSMIEGLTFGGDYRFGNRVIAGAALAYLSNRGDFDAGGNFDTDSYDLTLYASFMPTPTLFFDLSAGFASKSHVVNRRANFVEFDNGGNTNVFDGIVGSDADGSAVSFHGLFGYDHAIGSVTIGPRIGVNWTQTRIDGYAESGGGSGTSQVNGIRGVAGLALVYADQDVDSLQSVVGFQASAAGSASFGVIVTQVNADYIHEFSDSQRFVDVRFVQDLRQNPQVFHFQTENPVRDYFNLGISASVVLPRGLQPFLSFRGMLGNDQFDNYAATLGIRFEL